MCVPSVVSGEATGNTSNSANVYCIPHNILILIIGHYTAVDRSPTVLAANKWHTIVTADAACGINEEHSGRSMAYRYDQ